MCRRWTETTLCTFCQSEIRIRSCITECWQTGNSANTMAYNLAGWAQLPSSSRGPRYRPRPSGWECRPMARQFTTSPDGRIIARGSRGDAEARRNKTFWADPKDCPYCLPVMGTWESGLREVAGALEEVKRERELQKAREESVVADNTFAAAAEEARRGGRGGRGGSRRG